MPRVSTRRCRDLVKQRQPFKSHGNLYAVNTEASDGTPVYVVYSYGTHWPLFAYINGQWYENSQRYSVTTSRHHGSACPTQDTICMKCDDLRDFIEGGMLYAPQHKRVRRLLAVSI